MDTHSVLDIFSHNYLLYLILRRNLSTLFCEPLEGLTCTVQSKCVACTWMNTYKEFLFPSHTAGSFSARSGNERET